ncbi:FUSC family protein [Massilia sp.]|uniref:FUSC family protein n=1 Tax=Massilia sp. TaxID=1882437 RepID=UPI00391D3277
MGDARRRRVRAFLSDELRQLTTIQASDRAWQMPLGAALSSGLPLVAGAALGRIGDGLVASLGGLVFLYLPATSLARRMVALLACAFGMLACHTLGMLGGLWPPAIVPALVAITILVTMTCRIYALGPPGSLFFVMAAAIGAYSPVTAAELPRMASLIGFGSLLACAVGFVHSVFMLRRHAPQPQAPLPAVAFDDVVLDAVVIGAAVGVSLLAAQAMALPKPYWVPVSCLAVIQGVSLRAVWHRQLQRVLGTAAGVTLSWGLLSLPLGGWSVAALVMLLTFLIEMLVVRHYALAVVLITPLTILLAEAATLGQAAPSALVQARFVDTLLGCAIGLSGGWCLHDPRLRATAGAWLRRLAPGRARER